MNTVEPEATYILVGPILKASDVLMSGTLLENLQQFSDTFESYAMQRTLANNLYAYAFPATWGFV